MDEVAAFDLARLIAQEVAAGRLSRAAAERQLAERFRMDCPACLAHYDEALAALYAPAPTGVELGSTLGRRMTRFLADHRPVPLHESPPKPPPKRSRKSRALPAEELLSRALAAFEELKAAGWARRRERIHLEWQRFRGPEIARCCLSEAHTALPGDPEASAAWAGLALATLGGRRERGPESPEALVLKLRARLLQANAARCRGDFEEAREDLTFTAITATQLDVRDWEFWVEAKHMAASLERNLRDFEAAIREARAEAALAKAAGLPRAEVHARSGLTSIYELQGDFASALAAIRQAVPVLPALADPVLTIGVRHNEVAVLARLGRFGEAEALQGELDPLYEAVPGSQNHQRWTRGFIHAGLGRPAAAESDFRAARDGFLAAKNPYDAALVTLDWSLFLLDNDRAEEVLPLAVSMGQAFEALGVARETLASWAIFQAAAERQELDRAVAEELVRRVGEERGNGRKVATGSGKVSG